jgi:hypothetical protein
VKSARPQIGTWWWAGLVLGIMFFFLVAHGFGL